MDVVAAEKNRDEWQLWPTAGRGAHHRAQIKAWGEKKENWSGSGKHVQDTEIRHTMPRMGDELGMTVASFVERITYRSVPMARKMIRGNRSRPISELRKEVDIMQKLVHRHIVLLIGSYTSTFKQNRLYLLLYPAAVCDLKTFLQDIDDIRHGVSTHLAETSKRFESLGFKEVLPNPQSRSQSQHIEASSKSWHEPLKYLRSILGCMTEAVVYVHEQKVRHLDLKPGNILLTPNRVYLADFGISRNLEDASNSLTEGYAGGTYPYQAPEVFERREHHMSPAEIYSLGAIFLAIATVLYGENQSQFDSIMKELDPRLKASRITGFLSKLRRAAFNEVNTIDDSAATSDQKQIVDLAETMLEYEPERRPTALETNYSLLELGGQNQSYHEECCRKSATQLASIQAPIIKSLQTQKKAQTREILELRAKLHELQKQGDNKVHTLEKERDGIAQDLEIVRNGFDSRIENEKTKIASSWIRSWEKEKKEHEASKKELEIALAKIRKLEGENHKSKARKEKRNHGHGLGLPIAIEKKNREGTSTPSRLPIMKNSSSPLILPPKSFKSSTCSKSENDLTAMKFRTPPAQTRGNDDSDTYSLMAASGITLVGSISSISPPGSSPPSPLISKSINFDVPKLNGGRREASDISVSSTTSSKSYADMLRPTTIPMGNGIEKNAPKHLSSLSLRGPGAWKNKAAALGKT